jgi:S-formylglutathione hydrolase
MYSYVTEELPALIAANFPADSTRQGIFGHSMGGHGALVIAFRNPQRYRSVSAFSPIVAPSQCPWGEKAFGGYLGPDRAAWGVTAQTGTLPKSLRDRGRKADTPNPGRLRPQLLLHRDFHGRPLRPPRAAIALWSEDWVWHRICVVGQHVEARLPPPAPLLSQPRL